MKSTLTIMVSTIKASYLRHSCMKIADKNGIMCLDKINIYCKVIYVYSMYYSIYYTYTQTHSLSTKKNMCVSLVTTLLRYYFNFDIYYLLLTSKFLTKQKKKTGIDIYMHTIEQY